MDYFHTLAGQLALGAGLALLAAGAAYLFKLLTVSGAAAAFLLGWAVFGLGGWNWALILIVFFVSSSGWSLIFKQRKRQTEKMYAKGGRRDARQVLANGGIAGLCVLLHFIIPNSLILWVLFCAALAAANADTWATELGILNRQKPVLIVSGKHVEAGTSGAISLVGTLAAGAGAALIAWLAWLVKPSGLTSVWNLWLTGLVFLAGVSGSLVDSLLGATLQGVYFCPVCQKETEKHPLHNCGTETTLIRGKAWMNNEWVNLSCTLSAALIASLAIFLVK